MWRSNNKAPQTLPCLLALQHAYVSVCCIVFVCPDVATPAQCLLSLSKRVHLRRMSMPQGARTIMPAGMKGAARAAWVS